MHNSVRSIGESIYFPIHSTRTHGPQPQNRGRRYPRPCMHTCASVIASRFLLLLRARLLLAPDVTEPQKRNARRRTCPTPFDPFPVTLILTYSPHHHHLHRTGCCDGRLLSTPTPTFPVRPDADRSISRSHRRGGQGQRSIHRHRHRSSESTSRRTTGHAGMVGRRPGGWMRGWLRCPCWRSPPPAVVVVVGYGTGHGAWRGQRGQWR